VAGFLAQPLTQLRAQLLSVKGIGQETADSILLYAAQFPVFVVDTYTYRVLSRHNLVGETTSYEEMQALFMDNLNADVKVFNEYHALLVQVGKQYCRKKNPACSSCPLYGI
jgi:endonuclease-3 related protein